MQYGSIWMGNYLKRAHNRENLKGKTEAPSSLAGAESSQKMKMVPQHRDKTILGRQLSKNKKASVFHHGSKSRSE